MLYQPHYVVSRTDQSFKMDCCKLLERDQKFEILDGWTASELYQEVSHLLHCDFSWLTAHYLTPSKVYFQSKTLHHCLKNNLKTVMTVSDHYIDLFF
jgi:hypothetical protein